MQKAKGRKEEMDRRDQRDRDRTTRFVSDGFLLTASCLLPSVLSVSLRLRG
jgi:hypothetical protein